jgi:hypothetical protein
MFVNKLNLEESLLSRRKKFKSEAALLLEVKALFTENDFDRNLITTKLSQKSSTKPNQLQFDLLETNKIFHLEQIKNICIDYRLRFLDSDIFKNDIPEEAISKIANLEKRHKTKLNGFMVIAPSKAFHLVSYDDPLLFAPIGNNYYYFIHKWGNDMKPFRKIIVKPVRNLYNFFIASIIISALFTIAVPVNNLSKSVPLAPVIIFLFTFKSIVAVFLYYFFLVGKNFNEEIWNRKYYNN